MKYLNILFVVFSVFMQVNLFATNNFSDLNTDKDSANLTEASTTSLLEILGSDIVINWENTINNNCKGFEIERSKDRENWNRIGFVAFKKGITSYKFVDSVSSLSSKYYRIKRVKTNDFDENVKIIAELEAVVQGQSFSMSSNPVGNYLMMNNSQGLITIFNGDSEQVKQFTVKEESITLDTSDLSKGQYILHIQKENSTTISRLIIKN
jgi:hypothetical protein